MDAQGLRKDFVADIISHLALARIMGRQPPESLGRRQTVGSFRLATCLGVDSFSILFSHCS